MFICLLRCIKLYILWLFENVDNIMLGKEVLNVVSLIRMNND